MAEPTDPPIPRTMLRTPQTTADSSCSVCDCRAATEFWNTDPVPIANSTSSPTTVRVLLAAEIPPLAAARHAKPNHIMGP